MGMIGTPIRRLNIPEPRRDEPEPEPLLLPAPRSIPLEPWVLPVREPETVER